MMNRSTDANTVIKKRKIHLPFPSSTFSSMCFMRAAEREREEEEKGAREGKRAQEKGRKRCRQTAK
jgi:hypothetical protein